MARSRYGFVSDYAAVIDGFWTVLRDRFRRRRPASRRGASSASPTSSACRIMDPRSGGDRFSITSTDWDQNEVKGDPDATGSAVPGCMRRSPVFHLHPATVSYSDKALGVRVLRVDAGCSTLGRSDSPVVEESRVVSQTMNFGRVERDPWVKAPWN